VDSTTAQQQHPLVLGLEMHMPRIHRCNCSEIPEVSPEPTVGKELAQASVERVGI
jgi:hypothetical protein